MTIEEQIISGLVTSAVGGGAVAGVVRFLASHWLNEQRLDRESRDKKVAAIEATFSDFREYVEARLSKLHDVNNYLGVMKNQIGTVEHDVEGLKVQSRLDMEKVLTKLGRMSDQLSYMNGQLTARNIIPPPDMQQRDRDERDR